MKTIEKHTEIIFTSKIALGKVDGRTIFLSAPSWDCGWYWGFGYLGNRDCHYHVDGLNRYENINMYDAFKKHFDEGTLIINDSDLWTVYELFKSFYILKSMAELSHSGGAGYSSNPLKSQLKNKKIEDRINKILMPQIFNEIYRILIPQS